MSSIYPFVCLSRYHSVFQSLCMPFILTMTLAVYCGDDREVVHLLFIYLIIYFYHSVFLAHIQTYITQCEAIAAEQNKLLHAIQLEMFYELEYLTCVRF